MKCLFDFVNFKSFGQQYFYDCKSSNCVYLFCLCACASIRFAITQYKFGINVTMYILFCFVAIHYFNNSIDTRFFMWWEMTGNDSHKDSKKTAIERCHKNWERKEFVFRILVYRSYYGIRVVSPFVICSYLWCCHCHTRAVDVEREWFIASDT